MFEKIILSLIFTLLFFWGTGALIAGGCAAAQLPEGQSTATTVVSQSESAAPETVEANEIPLARPQVRQRKVPISIIAGIAAVVVAGMTAAFIIRKSSQL